MRIRALLAIVFVASIVSLASCIVGDQVSTLTIGPDGTAEWVRFQSNVRSTEPGERGAEELAQWVAAFDARTDSDHRHVLDAGGEITASSWIRKEEPYSNVIVARLGDSKALERFCTFRDGEGRAIVSGRFTRQGSARRLSILVDLPAESPDESSAEPTYRELRASQANAISETRIVVSSGRITEAIGFTVAADRRSALLEPAAIDALRKERRGPFELLLAWETSSSGAGE